jgi:hypothetical protein
MDYAKVGKMNRAELGVHFHQMKGDTAINSFASFYWVIAPGRAAIEIWDNPPKHFIWATRYAINDKFTPMTTVGNTSWRPNYKHLCSTFE